MKQLDVYQVTLDPTVGVEMRKARPAVIVSPDELNRQLGTVLVVPLTTGRSYPFRPATHFRGAAGVAAVDQLRAVDKRRLSRRLGALDQATGAAVLGVLSRMFAS